MSPQRDRYGRRTVLQAAGTTALAGLLAGCTDDGNGEPEEDEAENGSDDEPEEGTEDEDGSDGEFVDEEEEPDYGEFVDDIPNYEGTLDLRGEGSAEIAVGAGDQGLLFEPAAIMVDPGTEVVWEWTGEGGEHNVVSESGEEFESDLTDEEGFVFEHTLEEPGVTEYVCVPHEAQGKKGVIAVDGDEGEDETEETDEENGANDVDDE